MRAAMTVRSNPPRTRIRLRAAALAALVAVAGCSSSGNQQCPERLIAVLAAFPGELQPLVDRMEVNEEVELAGRTLRVGELGGVPVVVGMTGIGLVNSENTTSAVLDAFPVTGVVMSGVAGSFHKIGDVAVPETWRLPDGETFAVDAGWFEIAERLSGPGTVPLETCTELPLEPQAAAVCVEHQTAIYAGGFGQSDDPFNGLFPCSPEGDDEVFGCDIATSASVDGAGFGTEGHPHEISQDEEPASVDMETAALCREVEERGLPYIAFRAVSDGPGDPLNLPGFPSQFFAYYRLAARNAARATTAFLEELADSSTCG
jgi:nucleoside phosphorylase